MLAEEVAAVERMVLSDTPQPNNSINPTEGLTANPNIKSPASVFSKSEVSMSRNLRRVMLTVLPSLRSGRMRQLSRTPG
ncbi:MAG: hypothetical protein QME81_20070, partial [bacterium]|nr:hypothetical protein [bacterium]